jgi:alpha-galactosidase
MTDMPAAPYHLHAAGVSVVVAVDHAPGRLPWIAHWGADLGEPGDADLAALMTASSPPVVSGGPDEPLPVSLLPSESEGWIGRPGLSGSRRGRDFSPAFSVGSVTRLARPTRIDDDADGPGPADGDRSDGVIADGLRIDLTDPAARLDLAITVQLAASGLLRVRAELTNTELTNTDPESDYRLDGLHLALPVPPDADEVLDTAGHHARERVPQRRPFTVGVHARESRQGRPGLDGPLVLAAGVPGFGFERGPVWGVHLGWSGNQVLAAERTGSGERLLSGGELLLPGELILAPGEHYTSPWLYGSYGDGLNQFAARFHRYLRSRPRHPASPRAVTLNTWEAVYFDHDLDRLTALARTAARVGVERFVLDDGWFRGRRHDRAGLGDWQVDPDVWPDGLHPLVHVVRGLGLQFGLWVEPEMVNLDSDLARAHPDWLLRAGDRPGRSYRHQHVLDLANGDAYGYLAGCLHTLLDEYPIGYLKWDHNRPVTEAGHQPGGEPGVHRQTLATYRLMDELRAAHPGLEIESCASGGGRIDLGILARTDRVWTSDCIDALDLQQIQRYTQLVVRLIIG